MENKELIELAKSIVKPRERGSIVFTWLPIAASISCLRRLIAEVFKSTFATAYVLKKSMIFQKQNEIMQLSEHFANFQITYDM